jgi:hypothetical protein
LGTLEINACKEDGKYGYYSPSRQGLSPRPGEAHGGVKEFGGMKDEADPVCGVIRAAQVSM